MSQRNVRLSRARRMARRYGLAGSHASLAVLLVLACVSVAGGVLWHTHEGGFLIERSTAQELRGSTGSSGEVADDEKGDEESGEDEEVVRCFVHVDGAVASPGVVELTGADLRVYDAVQAAGGLMPEADTTAVNLAEPLADGAMIHIPTAGEVTEGKDVSPAGQAETSGATGTGDATVLVNINSATSEELQTLSGIGEATAAAIIEEREQNGPFVSPEDLMRVSGIGEKKFAKVKDHICV